MTVTVHCTPAYSPTRHASWNLFPEGRDALTVIICALSYRVSRGFGSEHVESSHGSDIYQRKVTVVWIHDCGLLALIFGIKLQVAHCFI